MSRRHQHKKQGQIAQELDITTFLNLMVVLIPFLLISAVFSRLAIMELSVPTRSGGAAINTPDFAIEVIVRKSGLEIANGRSVEAMIPLEDGEYNIEMLSEMLIRLKAQSPEKEDATILLEPDIEYDYLIQVMDTVRGGRIKADDGEETQDVVLFPEISIGDAP